MSQKQQTIYEPYYFPKNLQKRLDCIPTCPLTLIEAPLGFGKTTAIREYVRRRPEIQSSWYTCTGETSQKSWKNIAALFETADRKIAEGLVKFQNPNPDILPAMASLLRQCRSRHETFLVIDNYHLVGTKIPGDIINALAAHEDEKLHIIVITEPLTAQGKASVHTSRIAVIDTDGFRFDTESIDRYFRMEGLHLAGEDIEAVQKSTEGWIAAIRLQLIHYRDWGNFKKTGAMDSLIETAVWNRLDTEQRNIFLGLSLPDKCNPAQAAVMAGEKELPDSIKNLLEDHVFIFFYHDTYYMHGLLRDYLRKILSRDYDEAFRHTLIRRAAEASVEAGNDYEAKRFFYQIGDYDAILSWRYRYEHLDDEQDNYNFTAAVVRNCPDEILLRYPYSLVDFALHLVLYNKQPEFEKSMALLREALTREPLMTGEERKRLEGEIALVMSFTAFNNIRKMSAWIRRALEFFDRKPSRHLLPFHPWTFGNGSVLCLFWSVSGELEQEMKAMDESVPVYAKIVNGHGAGGNSMMRAEALFLSGRDAAAEVLCYKALYLAEVQLQTSICICAEFLLARIALFRGEGEAYFRGIERIRQRGEQGGQFYIRMAELCIAALSLTRGKSGEIALWIDNEETIRTILRPPAVPFGLIIYGKFLVLKKRYKELDGIAKALLSETGVPYMLPRLYGRFYLALVKQEEGKQADAAAELNRALEIAVKDRVFMPFAEDKAFRPLLEDVRRNWPEQKELDIVIDLCKQEEAGIKGIEQFFQSEKTPLSRREREIALLARKQHSVREIAGECFITEDAVKTLLENIYRKLNIHSRAELDKL
jgi:LuxR family maltose regulon positive regulatory protein